MPFLPCNELPPHFQALPSAMCMHSHKMKIQVAVVGSCCRQLEKMPPVFQQNQINAITIKIGSLYWSKKCIYTHIYVPINGTLAQTL